MQQLHHRLSDGKMEVSEVPVPLLSPVQVLVANRCSVISAGTEGRTAEDARKGYLSKALARKEEVQKVWKLARRQGWRATYNMVMRRLEAPAPLGYSCAGTVLAVGDRVTRLRPGDRVACAGSSASHAEVVAVPERLCASLPPGVGFEDAAFTTLGAIALQGMRQAEVQAGSTVVVIGLGLLGMLSVQILKASGIRVIGIDTQMDKVEEARKLGAGLALERGLPGMEEQVLEYTRGLGADAILITASSTSTDPVELAGILAGKKARVVVVGNVPTGFSRKHYYRKELDLRMSMSYGPGRYDPAYEEKGQDYPAGWVRWTLQRNMQAFLDLIAEGRMQPSLLISHTFSLEEAPQAFDLLLEKQGGKRAMLLRYAPREEIPIRIENTVSPAKGSAPGIGLIGAGSYALNILLPEIKKHSGLRGVASARGLSAKAAMDKFGFAFASGNADEVISDSESQAVFILTRHDTHASYARQALEQGKHVFVEKPTALHPQDLMGLRESLSARPGLILLTGFNRRFAPAIRDVMAALPDGLPRAIHIKVNAGKLPPEHWVHDPEQGGGRLVGEGCHFIHLACCLAASRPLDVMAAGMREAGDKEDSLSVILRFENGSIASLSYFSNGHPDLPKEKVELSSGGVSAHILDWKQWEVFGKKKKAKRLKVADKGHAGIVAAFMDAVKQGGSSPISFEEQYAAMMMSFAAQRALREARVVSMQEMEETAGKAEKEE
jgi:polar amino acid transport system substrate-binding protein